MVGKIECTGCEESKPATLEFFRAHLRCKSGLNPRCKVCLSLEDSEYRRRNGAKVCSRKRRDYRKYRAKRIASEKARRERHKAFLPLITRARILVAGVRERSRILSLPVDRCFRDYWYVATLILKQSKCPCCNQRFELFPTGRKAHQHSPSLDRFIPSYGYVIGNVALICWRCNNIKRDYQASDLKMVARWMAKFDKKR